MRCKGCEKDKELINSHIVPEWMYKGLYNSKRQFLAVSIDSIKPEISQKGIREYLLCKECESHLSKIERYVSLLFFELENQKYKKLIVSKLHERLLVLNGYNFTLLKQFLLSILWRSSVSKRPEFSEYNLGPYEAKIREIVFGERNVLWNDFPIIMTKLLIAGKPVDILALNSRGKYLHKTFYSFCLKGYYINFVIAEDFEYKEEQIFLTEKDFPLLSQDYKETEIITDDLIKRMLRKDVKSFYGK